MWIEFLAQHLPNKLPKIVSCWARFGRDSNDGNLDYKPNPTLREGTETAS